MGFMESFNGFAERRLLPIADKLASQKHLTALRNGMVASIPLSILGGASLILATPPFNPSQTDSTNFFFKFMTMWYEWAQANAYALKIPFNMSMGLMGLFVAFSIAYSLAGEYKLSQLDTSIVSTVVFLIVTAPAHIAVPYSKLTENLSLEEMDAFRGMVIPTQFLDAKGIFTAIIVSFGCVEIMRLLRDKNIRIKMPDGVPPAIASSFDAIIPLFLCVGVYYSFSLLLQSFSDGKLIPAFVMDLLAPAMTGLDSVWGIAFITFLSQLLWFFGLHGASITQFVRLPFMSAYIVANATAYTEGEPLKHFFTQPFWSYFITLGGGGATLALCILMVSARSVHLRKLGRLAIIPSIFNINEPLIFGIPLVLNPIMMIPFIFVPVINAILGYAVMNLGWIGKGFVETPWTTPAPLGAAIGTMDIRAGFFVIGLIILDIILYYPFFRVFNLEKIKEEQIAQ